MSAQPIPAPPVMHASRSIESVRPPSNDERRAHWAIRYFAAGWHRTPQKPRIKVTVPQSRAESVVPPTTASDSRSLPGCAAQASTCKDLVPVVRVLCDDETGEVYEVAERHVEYVAPPF